MRVRLALSPASPTLKNFEKALNVYPSLDLNSCLSLPRVGLSVMCISWLRVYLVSLKISFIVFIYSFVHIGAWQWSAHMPWQV